MAMSVNGGGFGSRRRGTTHSLAEINVTPDRGYAFSIRGVAREYAHATTTERIDDMKMLNGLSDHGALRSRPNSWPFYPTDCRAAGRRWAPADSG